MATFVYKAKDGPIRTVQGEISAETRAEAVARVDAMGYIPVSVVEKDAAAGEKRRFISRGIGSRDVTLFTRQLASLTRSGVPILRSLRTIAQQTDNRRLSRIVEDVGASIRDGRMLSEALRPYPRLFSELYVNMVRSGESGGALDTILFRLAETREAEEEVRRRVQSASAYPVLVAVVGAVTIFVLLSFFLPRIVVLFRDYSELPLPTRILIGVSDFFADYWYWVVFVVLLVGAVFTRLAAMEKGKAFVDGVKLRLPLVGRFVRDVDIARFSRMLALLIESGVPIDRALELGAATLRNTVLREEIMHVRHETVQQGETFSSGIRRHTRFPAFVSNMAAVGEEGGRLDAALVEVAAFYDHEVEQMSRMATSLVEPVLILTVGALVGFIVFAMLMPIFKIGGMI